MVFAKQFRLTFIALTATLIFPTIANATFGKKNNWSPYISVDTGISSQRINNVIFKNPRNPDFIQGSNNAAAPLGSFAVGTHIPTLPLRLELRTTINGQTNFNREYFFPSFFSVVGIQKLNISSNYLMLRGYWELPFQVIVPYLSLGAGASWNKTCATQYAPQLPGWIHNFVGTTQSNFAWSAGLGFTKPLTKNFVFNVGYHFIFLGKFDTGVLPWTGDEHIYGKLNSNELSVGFSYYL